MQKEPQIKDCFFRRQKDGACCSPEIYRFIGGMDTGNPCPFDAEVSAFHPLTGKFRCLEFRPNRQDTSYDGAKADAQQPPKAGDPLRPELQERH